MGKDPFDILMPVYLAQPNGETDRARALFTKFLNGGFSYNEISNHPDWMVYASAETLSIVLPKMIDEMLGRKDTINFLVYPMITAVDPNPELSGSSGIYKERSAKFITLADSDLIDKICTFLGILKNDSPVPEERLDRVAAFWKALQANPRA